jgi:capsid assembly protease
MTGNSQMNFPRLAQRLFNRPVLLDPTKAEILCAALQQRLGIVQFDRVDGTALAAAELTALANNASRRQGDDYKIFPMTESVAVIEIDGTLVHKSGWIDPTSGMTGYDGIARKFRAAIADPDVRAVWLDVDSPGGEVPGLFVLAEMIAKATESEGGKPVWAYVNEQACSAAYALSCVADRIYGPDGCISASIGACLMHVDYTKMLDKAGVEVTMFRSGDRKARGGAYENIDEATVEKLQGLVESTGARFADLVAMGRNVAADDILALQGDWFAGQDLVDLRLIDGLMSEEEAWDRLQSHIAKSR